MKEKISKLIEISSFIGVIIATPAPSKIAIINGPPNIILFSTFIEDFISSCGD